MSELRMARKLCRLNIMEVVIMLDGMFPAAQLIEVEQGKYDGLMAGLPVLFEPLWELYEGEEMPPRFEGKHKKVADLRRVWEARMKDLAI